MPGTYGHRPNPNAVVVSEKGWWATWIPGDPYIEVTRDRTEAKKLARGERANVVHAINTRGDEADIEKLGNEVYVKRELATFVEDSGEDYTANGY
jgi:hypothetical protein